ncbi:uncharacterized protein LOC115246203 [Formica exsecta]|uniref:uncharacterized protein LOC115246203 n=1 Tax=Formica exsecta TaxID=72781 RepID=UPI001141CC91|nr:uncharacterized protein LOC115246203 [Formica exsecta]
MEQHEEDIKDAIKEDARISKEDLQLAQVAANMEMAQPMTTKEKQQQHERYRDMTKEDIRITREDMQLAEIAAKLETQQHQQRAERHITQTAAKSETQQRERHRIIVKANQTPRQPIWSAEISRSKDQEDQLKIKDNKIILLRSELNKLKRQLAANTPPVSSPSPAQAQAQAPENLQDHNISQDIQVVPHRWARAGRNRGRGYNRRGGQKSNVFNISLY